MRHLGLLELRMRDGSRVLVPGELVGLMREVPGKGDVPDAVRVTLRGRQFYEDLIVMDTLEEVAEMYAELILEGREVSGP